MDQEPTRFRPKLAIISGLILAAALLGLVAYVFWDVAWGMQAPG